MLALKFNEIFLTGGDPGKIAVILKKKVVEGMWVK